MDEEEEAEKLRVALTRRAWSESTNGLASVAGMVLQLYMTTNSLSLFTMVILFSAIRDPLAQLFSVKTKFVDGYGYVSIFRAYYRLPVTYDLRSVSYPINTISMWVGGPTGSPSRYRTGICTLYGTSPRRSIDLHAVGFLHVQEDPRGGMVRAHVGLHRPAGKTSPPTTPTPPATTLYVSLLSFSPRTK